MKKYLIQNPINFTKRVTEHKEVKGLTIIENFLGQNELKELNELVKQLKGWGKQISRDTIHFGKRYDYQSSSLKDNVGGIPEWLNGIVKKVEVEGGFEQPIDQIIINKYKGGQGIAEHIDSTKCFGDTIATFSLGESVFINFKNSRNLRHPVLAKENSILILKGDSRKFWKHSLSLGKNQSQRISITFRSIKK